MLLHRQKCVIKHRNIRHSLRNSPSDCFCQMLRIWSLVSQVQILQTNKKGSRTFRLLHRQKCVIEHRNTRHLLRNSPPDCFCQMLRIWSLVSQVQILQINKKRKQDIPAAPPAEMRNQAQRYKALAAKQSPGLFLPNAAHLEPRVANSNLVNKQKRKQDIPATPPAERSNRAQRYKALAAKQSPGLFLPNAAHLEPRVASSNLVNKQKRKQDSLKNVLLPFGRGDKNIGTKFGFAAGFLPYCTATVLQRRYCPQGSASLFLSPGSIFLRSIRGKLLHIGVCRLCVLILIIGEHIAVGV